MQLLYLRCRKSTTLHSHGVQCTTPHLSAKSVCGSTKPHSKHTPRTCKRKLLPLLLQQAVVHLHQTLTETCHPHHHHPLRQQQVQAKARVHRPRQRTTQWERRVRLHRRLRRRRLRWICSSRWRV